MELTFLCCLPELKGDLESLSHGEGDSLSLQGRERAGMGLGSLKNH